MSAAITLGISWTAVPMLSQSNTSHAHSLKLEYSNRSNWRFGTPVPSGVSSMAIYQLFISIQIRGFSSQPHILVGGFNLPLLKILLRQLGLLSPIYGKNVPNHQPVYDNFHR